MPLSTVWSILWQVLFYGWGISEAVLGIRTRTSKSTGSVRDRGTLRLLWIVILSSITVAFWIGAAAPHNLFGGAPWLSPLSLAVLAAGLILRAAAVITLGKSFSSNVAIHSTQTVLKTGLYRWMRHPSYTGMLVIFLGVGIHTRNWIGLAVAFLPTTAALLYRIHVEEIALREHFGAEYIDYSRKTRRLIPSIY
jgi:protein-S-isoprenylcysteine O-methyltransferase